MHITAAERWSEAAGLRGEETGARIYYLIFVSLNFELTSATSLLQKDLKHFRKRVLVDLVEKSAKF